MIMYHGIAASRLRDPPSLDFRSACIAWCKRSCSRRATSSADCALGVLRCARRQPCSSGPASAIRLASFLVAAPVAELVQRLPMIQSANSAAMAI